MGNHASLVVDLQWEKNNMDHHTEVFREDGLIVRRGQPFIITLDLTSTTNLQQKLNKSKLSAQTGPSPAASSGTKISMELNGEKEDSGWSAAASLKGNTISLKVCPSPSAPIGKYSLVLSDPSKQEADLGKFVLLFNPWCPDDTVYMEKKEEREEYVLSQDGIIYGGDAKNITHWAWNFGQFESGVLKASLKILNESLQHKKNADKDCSKRNDPIYVTRVLSAMVNTNDDSGVLSGRWSGNYDGGVDPSKWTGSVEILRQWHDSNCKSVRYGQCWVFAGVGCTVARALGIPCRLITNFESAHDTNGDLKIETYVREDGRMVKEIVWNFHCWLESWMKRPDLKPGYDGWQVSDPTPQEPSEGVMCCGPVPVKAIKIGDLTCQYDAAFVYAEVNADIITTFKLYDGLERNVVNKITVGQNISTKSIGKDAREDVTHLYKYEEGLALERQSYMHAQVCQELDLCFEDHGEIMKGSDFVLNVTVTNKTSAVKSIKLQFTSGGMFYNGKPDNETIQVYAGEHSISPGKVLKIPLKHRYLKYAPLLSTGSQLQVWALLTDMDTDARLLEKHYVSFKDPKINIKVTGNQRVGHASLVKLSVENPLPETLPECWFCIEGANLTHGEKPTRRILNVGPKETATAKFYFTPTQSGLRKLLVIFSSTKLGHIKSYVNLSISK
ncbi:protein-glutamine gamma-glutamyltransferase 2 [Astyanax mexicanus]|uniref:protein-glutamine gamma-glutamyltransferase 2 n=1 Tax=Astyanax mexicanus TaxID=7994 RepID=UPI0020CB558F|nr:protein-glutamine gamma-glutamyltransferase 2 [Astyanax mexicanus]